MSVPEPIVLAFASGSEDLIETFLDNLEAALPGLPLHVVSEFPPPRGRWIPWFLGRTHEQNLARISDAVKDKAVAYSAMILQPRMPYWSMRLAALKSAPSVMKVLCFNENLDHFALHPRSALAILKHLLWRAFNFIRWETRPGGWTYTQVWRLFHPSAFKRPILYRRVLAVGRRAAERKRRLAPRPVPKLGPPLDAGITVVVPSRNGRELLERLLPGLVMELEGSAHEIVVVDNGSEDGTAGWLATAYPLVIVETSGAALSFAAAVNRGIRRARFSRVCLLNNDMVLEEGFFPALLGAFEKVPDLFCATAQIFFPEGVRREETGKAVYGPPADPGDFPIRCDTPLAGEDLSYVLYGSGGCSMYDTRKLRAIGCYGEVFTPAYVEDLDAGYRGWVRGWPTVFVAGARLVHYHRSTTKRYFTPEQIQIAVDVNYARFLARSVADPELFEELFQKAVVRLNYQAAKEPPPRWAYPALKSLLAATEWVEPPPAPVVEERLVFALGSGDVVSFPGRITRDAARPAVLIASPYVPFPLSHGGAVRIYNLMRRAAREFDQILIAFCDEHQTPAPEILDVCVEVILVRRKGSHMRPMTERPEVVEEHDNAAFRAGLREMIRKHAPSLVQLEFTQMGLYAPDCHGLPTLLVEHDVTLDLYRQLSREQNDWETRAQLERWERFEREAWRRVSCVITMSTKDRGMIEGARRVDVLANGVDLERFQPSVEDLEARRILFIGSFNHLPNLMALDYFLKEAWPALRARQARLHVISGARADHYRELYRDRVMVDLDDPLIEVEGFVSDVRGAYQRAEVVIAPLLASAGTNIKIMEAMAMGKAIVSTPAGINGLDLRPGDDVVVVNTGREMAEQILDLFANPTRRKAIEAAARLTVERQYDWDAIAEAQARTYRELISGPSAATKP